MHEAFTGLSEFNEARVNARAQRDLAQDRLERRWSVLRDPRTRTELVKEAMGAVFQSWTPVRRVRELLQDPITGKAVTAMGMVLAGAQPTWGRRLLFSGLSVIMGKAMRGHAPSEAGPLGRFGAALGRGLRFMQARRADRQRHS
jgi:hypothetical protein